MPKDIRIVPASASIQFSGSAVSNIQLQVQDSGSVSFVGISGSLMTIEDSFSGSLMSVGNISGLPLLEVFDDGTTVAGPFNSNALVVTGSRVGFRTRTPAVTLDVSGSGRFTDGLVVSSSLVVSGSGYSFSVRDSAVIGNTSDAMVLTSDSIFGRGGMGLGTSIFPLQSGNRNLRLMTPTDGSGGSISIGYYKAGVGLSWNRAFSVSNSPAIPYVIIQGDAGNTTVGATVDIGARLAVRGEGTTSATSTLIIQNATPTRLFEIDDNGQFIFNTPSQTLPTNQAGIVVSQSITTTATPGSTAYGVNIVPIFTATTGSLVQTALRVVPTFTGSFATSSLNGNVIAEFGTTNIGTQLSVTDVTSGSIYQVNDISGLPILEANSDWSVRMYNFPTAVFEKTGSQVNINGTLRVSGSFVFPSTSSTNPQTGSAFWSGSFLFIYDGTRYRSSSFA